MKKLIKYLYHRPTWHKLPMLPRMYSTDFKVKDVDRETQVLMQLTHTRCPQGVEVLKKRHGLKSSRDLIEQLPARRRKRHVLRRVISLIQIWFGLIPYNPMKSLAQKQRHRARASDWR